MGELLRELSQREQTFYDCPITPKDLSELVIFIEKGTINGRIGKTVFSEMISTGDSPEKIIKDKGLFQVTDSTEILKLVKQAIENNPKPVEQLQEGKDTALNFLVGQVMKFSRGKANPQLAAEMIKKELQIEN